MTDSETPKGKAILALLAGDSTLGEVVLNGKWRTAAKSKVGQGTAYFVELEEPSREILRVHTADPRFVLADLEDHPASRLPGMAMYIGGAFVRLYGKQTHGDELDASAFSKYLGTAEAMEKEGQQLLEIPQSAHEYDAALVVTRSKLDFSVDLEFRVACLSTAAELLARVGVSGLPSAIELGRLLAMWGSYFGQCIIHDYGGRWHMDPKVGEVVLIPRGPLPPVKVSPYRVIERTIRTGNPSLFSDWLGAIEGARKSTDFQSTLVR